MSKHQIYINPLTLFHAVDTLHVSSGSTTPPTKVAFFLPVSKYTNVHEVKPKFSCQ